MQCKEPQKRTTPRASNGSSLEVRNGLVRSIANSRPGELQSRMVKAVCLQAPVRRGAHAADSQTRHRQ
ncbi:hypothetical protein P3T16_003570 [Paraburkholderia sp. GAS42]|jgi:hypothetical protein